MYLIEIVIRMSFYNVWTVLVEVLLHRVSKKVWLL